MRLHNVTKFTSCVHWWLGALRYRKWYTNLDETTKTKYIQQKLEKKNTRSADGGHTARPVLAQKEKVNHKPMTPNQPKYVDTNDGEYDTALFEPTDQDYEDDEGWFT